AGRGDRHALVAERGRRRRAGGPRPAPARAAGGIPPHAPGDAPAPGRLLPPGLAAHPRRLSQPDPPSPRALLAGAVARARTPAPPRAGAQLPKYLPLRGPLLSYSCLMREKGRSRAAGAGDVGLAGIGWLRRGRRRV